MKQRSIVRGVYREDVDEYPVVAIREAVINALVHRDLSSYARGTPVQVQMFSNRLVVHNPGGLFGPVTVDSLGREGISATRNSTLLRLLEDIAPRGDRQAVCENRGSGVGAMLAALSQAQLPPPAFDDRISTFGVSFYNTSISRRKDRRNDIASLLRDKGDLSRAEISQSLGLSDIAIRKWLATMRSEGTIVAIGAKPKSKHVRYALSGKRNG